MEKKETTPLEDVSVKIISAFKNTWNFAEIEFVKDAIEEYVNSKIKTDNEWINEGFLENAFKQFYPDGEECTFSAHAAAQICEVIIKNKLK